MPPESAYKASGTDAVIPGAISASNGFSFSCGADIVPQHLADDPVDWQKAIAEYGLPTDFDVEGDENRMASCGQDNRRKCGDLLPPNYAILLLQTASKKAPLVKKLRTKWISDRKRGRTLADVGKALAQQPSFRDQLMAMIHPEFPPAKPSAANWGDITASARTKQLLGAASNALLGWAQERYPIQTHRGLLFPDVSHPVL